MEEYDIPYSETVEGRGDRGAFLAPDECRICWRYEDKIVQNCEKHK